MFGNMSVTKLWASSMLLTSILFTLAGFSILKESNDKKNIYENNVENQELSMIFLKFSVEKKKRVTVLVFGAQGVKKGRFF